jgi:hypothetical protein
MTVNTGCGGVLSCGSVVVHNAFSNGDGINEKFVIDNDILFVIQIIQ